MNPTLAYSASMAIFLGCTVIDAKAIEPFTRPIEARPSLACALLTLLAIMAITAIAAALVYKLMSTLPEHKD